MIDASDIRRSHRQRRRLIVGAVVFAVAIVAVFAAAVVFVLFGGGATDEGESAGGAVPVSDDLTAVDRPVGEDAAEAEDEPEPEPEPAPPDPLAALASIEADGERMDLSAYPDVAAAVDAYGAWGYDVSFVLYSFDTGSVIGYNVDRTYFCASAVKAPFAAFVLEDLIDTGAEPADEVIHETEVRGGSGTMDTDGIVDYALGEVIERTVVESDNTGYRLLWRRYGGQAFDAWAARFGVPAGAINGAEYPSLSARTLARLWAGIAAYADSGSDRGTWLADMLARTDHSFIRPLAGEGATVLSKPGYETNRWHTDEPTFDYGALHDAGIVIDEAGTWLIVVMSNANFDNDYQPEARPLIDGLISVLLDVRVTKP